MLELDVYHDKSIGPTTRKNFLGRIRLSATQFVKKGEEALIYYPLEKKYWFTWISGEICLNIYFVEQLLVPEVKAEPKQAPPAEPTETAPEGEKPNSIEEDPPAQVVENATTVEAELPANEAENPTSVLMDPPQENEFNQVKRYVSLGSIPEVKVSNNINIVNGPRPISRASSVIFSDVGSGPIEQSSFDLVEKMHYLFVRVVKARSLPTVDCPVVKIVVSGSHVISSQPGKQCCLSGTKLLLSVKTHLILPHSRKSHCGTLQVPSHLILRLTRQDMYF